MYLLNKNVYWPKMCLLAKNVSIEWKCAYWIKIYLLIENVLIGQESVCWMKMCLLNENVHTKRFMTGIYKIYCNIRYTF